MQVGSADADRRHRETRPTRFGYNGVKVVPAFLLQPVSVDASNYQKVLVDSGYYTAGQLA
ncbi:hypothetical protein TUM20983_54330 [Mycobacterium antarcticum]|nr:hypothetical protein TUM20983_54330 [Mycolicibacterium sp. TUM20983]